MGKPNEAALELFRGLLWPAVAGNVLWSLASLVMKGSTAEDTVPVASRVLLLLLLGFYLTLEFLRNYRNLPDPVRIRFWLFDSIHLLGAVVSALGAYESLPFLLFGLAIYLTGTGLGHAFGAYATPEKGSHAHLVLAAINFSGLPFVALSHFHLAYAHIYVPASFGVPLALWLIARRRNIAALGS